MQKQLRRGMYIIFEGADGTSKSTSMQLVAQQLRKRLASVFSGIVVRETHHPGSSPLGAHLRQVIKRPHEIDPKMVVDDLTRQILHLADASSFIQTMLISGLENREIILADRSTFISALVYASADGIPVTQIQRILNVVSPPKADRVFVLRCPWEERKRRIHNSRVDVDSDHYDAMEDHYHHKIGMIYDQLVTASADMTIAVSGCVSIDNIHYVDTDMDQDNVISEITNNIVRLICEREDVNTSQISE